MSYFISLLILCSGLQANAFDVNNQSIEQLRASVQARPLENQTRLVLIDKYLAENKVAAATAEFETYKKLDPRLEMPGAKAASLGILFAKETFKSTKTLALEIVKDPHSNSRDVAAANIALGDLALMGLTKGDAADRYAKALRLEPENYEIRHRLARVHMKANQNDKAMALLSELITAGHKDDRIRYDYLAALIQSGKNQAAAERLSEWYNAEPGNPWLAEAQARQYIQLNQKEAAKKVLQTYAASYQPTSRMGDLLRGPASENVQALPIRPVTAQSKGIELVASEKASSPATGAFTADVAVGSQWLVSDLSGTGFNSELKPDMGTQAKLAFMRHRYGLTLEYAEQKYKAPAGITTDDLTSQEYGVLFGQHNELTSSLVGSVNLNYRQREGIENASNVLISSYQMWGLQGGLQFQNEIKGAWSYALSLDLALPFSFEERSSQTGQLKWAYFAKTLAELRYQWHANFIASIGVGFAQDQFQFKGTGDRGVTDAAETSSGAFLPIHFTWIL